MKLLLPTLARSLTVRERILCVIGVLTILLACAPRFEPATDNAARETMRVLPVQHPALPPNFENSMGQVINVTDACTAFLNVEVGYTYQGRQMVDTLYGLALIPCPGWGERLRQTQRETERQRRDSISRLPTPRRRSGT